MLSLLQFKFSYYSFAMFYFGNKLRDLCAATMVPIFSGLRSTFYHWGTFTEAKFEMYPFKKPSGIKNYKAKFEPKLKS